MQEVILVKLGEIVLKGLNRRVFEDRLLKNIRRRVQRAGNFDVYSMQSTVYVVPKDEDADIDEAEERVAKVFGVIGYTRACVCEKSMDAILATAPDYLRDTLAEASTFKVESKRADKKFPLDSMQISREVGAALLRANGKTVITENIFENRYRQAPELMRLGADITLSGKTAEIWGVERLRGTSLTATDLRGGAAMIIAGLCAEGETVICDDGHVKRGYEHLDSRLRALGADIYLEH